MTKRLSSGDARQPSRPRALVRDRRGASAVETALIMLPFLILLLGTLQTGIYFMEKSALDAGVLRTASGLRGNILLGSFTTPTASSLTSSVLANAGALVSASTLAVDLRTLDSLSAAVVPIANGTVSVGSTNSVLVLRASATVISFVPFIGQLRVVSAAIIRGPSTT